MFTSRASSAQIIFLSALCLQAWTQMQTKGVEVNLCHFFVLLPARVINYLMSIPTDQRTSTEAQLWGPPVKSDRERQRGGGARLGFVCHWLSSRPFHYAVSRPWPERVQPLYSTTVEIGHIPDPYRSLSETSQKQFWQNVETLFSPSLLFVDLLRISLRQAGRTEHLVGFGLEGSEVNSVWSDGR